MAIALTVLEVVPTPAVDVSEEALVRDAADRPILRAAIAAKADVLVTGDRDFLEYGITNPKIVTAAEFLQMDLKQLFKAVISATLLFCCLYSIRYHIINCQHPLRIGQP